MNEAQRAKMATGEGFVAALDQSGGSTPGALRRYGVADSDYSTDDEMFDLMHEFRSRIITSPRFGGDRILGAILFEQTMDRTVDGLDTVRYLWERKHIVPFVKVDQGLAPEADGVRLMKPLTRLEPLLERALARGVFGTKMRSFIRLATPAGVNAVLDQQFAVGEQILRAGLMPILEPEVDVTSPEKARAEELLWAGIMARLRNLPPDAQVMFKLSIPSFPDFYSALTHHSKVLRVVALSGGYSRAEATDRLARNPGLVASFSRALTEGLTRQQSDEEFDKMLDESISSIYVASVA
jgi:fructose-bisphosphate aldolase, class I